MTNLKSRLMIKPHLSKTCICEIDILGYSKLVTRSDSEQFLEKFDRVVKKINTILGSDQFNDLNYRWFTDNIYLYTEHFGENPDQDSQSIIDMMRIATIIQKLFVVDLGVLTRGALLVSDAYINNDYMYGQALCLSHFQEGYINYPLIRIDGSIFDYIAEEHDQLKHAISLQSIVINKSWCINYLGIHYDDDEYDDEIVMKKHGMILKQYGERLGSSDD